MHIDIITYEKESVACSHFPGSPSFFFLSTAKYMYDARGSSPPSHATTFTYSCTWSTKGQFWNAITHPLATNHGKSTHYQPTH